MKRQLNDSDDELSNKCVVKSKPLSCYSSQSMNEYCVYWFDEIDSDLLKYYHVDQSRLRGIIDYLQIFNKFNQCETTIRESIGIKLFIIVNASNYTKFVTLFNDLEEVHSIYTYKDQSFDNEQCKISSKFHGIFDNPNEIFSKLSKSIRIYSRHIISEETSNTLMSLPEKPERTTNLHSEIEIMNWFTYLYNVLEEIPPSNNGKEIFVQEYQNLNKDKISILRSIEEFNKTYDSKKAIWWYTREGFLFRFLNRALRQQNQHDIILIHFFIYDLAQQLKIESNQNKDAKWMDGSVYRGQLMSIDEIKFIERRQQQTLYINTFLSTSTDFELVKIFAGVGFHNIESSIQSVIFHINGLGDEDLSGKSVADIHHLSFSNEENEILFSPAYTFVSDKVIYNENDKVWNIHLNRITDAYDPKIEFDQYLIKLDILIRLMSEQIDSPLINEDINLSFINNLSLLVQELNNYKSINITFEENKINQFNKRISPYELTSVRTAFVECSSNHQYKISPLILTTLNDCLANIYKQNGKYNLAFEYFNKIINSNDHVENIRTIYNRKINLAQTHKLVGNYATAWSIFEQLEEDELTKLFNYERLFRDIALDLSTYDNNVTLFDKLVNCFNYLEYVFTQADLDADGFTIAETYVRLGHMYLYDCNNHEYAILCFNRDLDIQRISDPDESLAFGPNYERLADAYVFLDIEKALENYEKAIDQYSRLGNSSNIEIALCWCKVGHLYSEHKIEPFNRALTLILSIDNDKHYLLDKDEIASCLLYLAKSCARCESFFEMAFEICQIIFGLYPYEPESKAGIGNDFSEWLELLTSLYEKKSKLDASIIVPTKEELLQTWKNSSLMNISETIQMLKSIQQKLNATTFSN